MSIILAIAAHPDDEALGVAGTLARHVADGDEVHVVFLADGEGARGSVEHLSERRKASEDACAALGVKNVQFFDCPDNRMDSVALLDIVQIVEGVLKEVQPDIIYTHHGGDLNVDHNLTHRAVMTACRAQPGETLQAIYGFEVLSSTEWASPDQDIPFRPNHHVDITDFMDQKMKSLKFYDAEMRDFPHSRSYEAVEALATLRGAQAGFRRAESFTVIRSFWR